MAHSAAARFGLDEICNVVVNVDAHVAGVQPDDSARLRGCVFHEHSRIFDGVGGG